jgi:hypothetical protein
MRDKSRPLPMIYLTTCRVCGYEFRSRRFDAITCGATCRQRLKRGHGFAYLKGMSRRRQTAERMNHAAGDQFIEEQRQHRASVRDERAARKAKRQERQREQLLIEAYAGMARDKMWRKQQEARRRVEMGVVGALKLFAQQRRDDMSAEAIWQFLIAARLLAVGNRETGDRISVEQIAEALDTLRAEGHYDRIIAEAVED